MASAITVWTSPNARTTASGAVVSVCGTGQGPIAAQRVERGRPDEVDSQDLHRDRGHVRCGHQAPVGPAFELAGRSRVRRRRADDGACRTYWLALVALGRVRMARVASRAFCVKL